MRKFLSLATVLLALLALPPLALARTTPEDIVNAQMETLNSTLNSYSPENQQKVRNIIRSTAKANANACTYLEAITARQGAILDEYLSRKNFQETQSIKDARYWLTFAHEAIDYQKQRVYLPQLTGEANIQRDLRVMINNFQSQLNYARGTAVKTQGKILGTVSGKGSQTIVDPTTATQSGGGD